LTSLCRAPTYPSILRYQSNSCRLEDPRTTDRCRRLGAGRRSTSPPTGGRPACLSTPAARSRLGPRRRSAAARTVRGRRFRGHRARLPGWPRRTEVRRDRGLAALDGHPVNPPEGHMPGSLRANPLAVATRGHPGVPAGGPSTRPRPCCAGAQWLPRLWGHGASLTTPPGCRHFQRAEARLAVSRFRWTLGAAARLDALADRRHRGAARRGRWRRNAAARLNPSRWFTTPAVVAPGPPRSEELGVAQGRRGRSRLPASPCKYSAPAEAAGAYTRRPPAKPVSATPARGRPKPVLPGSIRAWLVPHPTAG
jgi:hypothetical protein